MSKAPYILRSLCLLHIINSADRIQRRFLWLLLGERSKPIVMKRFPPLKIESSALKLALFSCLPGHSEPLVTHSIEIPNPTNKCFSSVYVFTERRRDRQAVNHVYDGGSNKIPGRKQQSRAVQLLLFQQNPQQRLIQEGSLPLHEFE